VRDVDAVREWEAVGIADLIILYHGRPLAVVELKRESKALKYEDCRQALSYAAQMTPRPPLTIVTNGTSTLVYDSMTGDPCTAPLGTGDAVSRLFENAAMVAAAGLEWAVEVLLGSEAGLWAGAVRARTSELVEQMSGAAGEITKPFVRDLSIPRRATDETIASLGDGSPLILLTGVPQIGKTSILRDLACRTADSEDFAVFMIRGGLGAGLFQRIANLLSAALEWPADADDIRQWLRRLSRSGRKPTLVLAIDGLVPNSAVARDVEELCEANLGPWVRIVATTDNIEGLLLGPNGRDATPLSQVAQEIEVEPLDEKEWKVAKNVLLDHRIRFTRGASVSLEYRIPWVLRSVLANVQLSPKYPDENFEASIPSSLGLDLVGEARRRLAHYGSAESGYRLLARDAVADSSHVEAGVTLEQSYSFVVRRDALSEVSREVLPELVAQGWVNCSRNATGIDVIRPTSPELFLSEYAYAVADALKPKAEANPREAGQWIADRLDGVFLGDLIGAQAILDLAQSAGGYSSELFKGLLDRRPQSGPLSEGVYALMGPDGSMHQMHVTKDGLASFTDANGRIHGEPIDLRGGTDTAYRDVGGWMILSQLASIRAVADSPGQPRVDLAILLEVGTCRIPLMRVVRVPQGHRVHNFPGHGEIMCEDDGVVEPITLAMFHVFATDWQGLDEWFDAALERHSLPLLYRIQLALGEISKLAGSPRARWARNLIDERISPAIEHLVSQKADSES
jgi:hypothetical protein